MKKNSFCLSPAPLEKVSEVIVDRSRSVRSQWLKNGAPGRSGLCTGIKIKQGKMNGWPFFARTYGPDIQPVPRAVHNGAEPVVKTGRKNLRHRGRISSTIIDPHGLTDDSRPLFAWQPWRNKMRTCNRSTSDFRSTSPRPTAIDQRIGGPGDLITQ